MTNPVVIDFLSLTGQAAVLVDPDAWTRFAEIFAPDKHVKVG